MTYHIRNISVAVRFLPTRIRAILGTVSSRSKFLSTAFANRVLSPFQTNTLAAIHLSRSHTLPTTTLFGMHLGVEYTTASAANDSSDRSHENSTGYLFSIKTFQKVLMFLFPNQVFIPWYSHASRPPFRMILPQAAHSKASRFSLHVFVR